MNSQTCPECGHPMKRDSRPITLCYKGLSATFDMPGWYCSDCSEGVHSGKDMLESDHQLNLLKTKKESLTSSNKLSSCSGTSIKYNMSKHSLI